MAPEARNKFGAPKFESELFRNQIYYIAESTFDIVGVFGAPRSDLAPEELCPPHYAPGWETVTKTCNCRYTRTKYSAGTDKKRRYGRSYNIAQL